MMCECIECEFRLWPAPCFNAARANPRRCELVHKIRYPGYPEALDRAMCGVPAPPAPGEPARPCCGQPDAPVTGRP